jgi:hypothetical protein
MALSGSYDFNKTRNDIIESAWRKTGDLSRGDVLSAEQAAEGAAELNDMVKQWQGEGIKLWSVELATQTLTASSEVVGTDGNNYFCIRAHTSTNATKPVTGADYTTYWKLGGSSGGVWAVTTAYTSLNSYVLDSNVIGIEEAFVRRDTTYQDTPLDIIPREDWMKLGNKYTTGPPSKIWFQRKHTPEIHLYPYPDDSTDVIHFSQILKTQDFDTAADDPDLSSEWLSALTWGLAARLAFEAGLPPDERRDLKTMATETKEAALFGTQETGPVNISPDLRST